MEQLDQQTLQTLLDNSGGTGGSGVSLTPQIPEELVTTLIVSFVVMNILGLIFIIFYVTHQIRSWKVQSATLRMQKDIAEINMRLSAHLHPTAAPMKTEDVQSVRIEPSPQTPDASNQASS